MISTFKLVCSYSPPITIRPSPALAVGPRASGSRGSGRGTCVGRPTHPSRSPPPHPHQQSVATWPRSVGGRTSQRTVNRRRRSRRGGRSWRGPSSAGASGLRRPLQAHLSAPHTRPYSADGRSEVRGIGVPRYLSLFGESFGSVERCAKAHI